MRVVNIRRVYATNKNKASIIIWPSTVNTMFSYEKRLTAISKKLDKLKNVWTFNFWRNGINDILLFFNQFFI